MEESIIFKKRPKGQVNFDITLSEEQKIAKEKILSNTVSFIIGKVGSGKTLLATQLALDLLFRREVERIVITRPTVSTEENGFLPGSLKEKMDPWLVPIRDNMRKVYNHPDKLKKMEDELQIELVALSHFRGRTFDNAVCIVDEFQNLTKQQLVMCLGRLGKNSMMFFCGDSQQVDLKFNNDSAIHEIAKIENCTGVCKVILTENHRHPVLDEILKALNGY